MTINLTCPSCDKVSDEEFLDILQAFHEGDRSLAATGLTCGRTILVAHMVNTLGIIELLHKDPSIEQYSLEDIIQKAKEMLPRMKALAKKGKH